MKLPISAQPSLLATLCVATAITSCAPAGPGDDWEDKSEGTSWIASPGVTDTDELVTLFAPRYNADGTPHWLGTDDEPVPVWRDFDYHCESELGCDVLWVMRMQQTASFAGSPLADTPIQAKLTVEVGYRSNDQVYSSEFDTNAMRVGHWHVENHQVPQGDWTLWLGVDDEETLRALDGGQVSSLVLDVSVRLVDLVEDQERVVCDATHCASNDAGCVALAVEDCEIANDEAVLENVTLAEIRHPQYVVDENGGQLLFDIVSLSGFPLTDLKAEVTLWDAAGERVDSAFVSPIQQQELGPGETVTVTAIKDDLPEFETATIDLVGPRMAPEPRLEISLTPAGDVLELEDGKLWFEGSVTHPGDEALSHAWLYVVGRSAANEPLSYALFQLAHDMVPAPGQSLSVTTHETLPISLGEPDYYEVSVVGTIDATARAAGE